ncbi:hypothetical protein LUZ60_007164 [Juncus effusus]|nr:hypothetical protein LUZ60_007164 [Juncus effusus]
MKALRRTATSSPATGSPPAGGGSWIRSLLVVSPSSFSSSPSSSSPSPSPLSISSRKGSLKSPWSRRKRKRALSRRSWYTLFNLEGKLRDGGVKFLKKVRNRGIDPSIRAEVWPFLLGVYDLNTTEAERTAIKTKKRKEFLKLRQKCKRLLLQLNNGSSLNSITEDLDISEDLSPLFSQDLSSSTSLSKTQQEDQESDFPDPELPDSELPDSEFPDSQILVSSSSSSSDSDPEIPDSEIPDSESPQTKFRRSVSVKKDDPVLESTCSENFATWQRIIRLDAVRVHQEWALYSPNQLEISADSAARRAGSVGLKDYENLDPPMVHHATRLVIILEAYAVYDPEIGYCQGMSDLLSPIIAVINDDFEAFWCFAGFMKKARHNFRLDEVGIKRQLNIISRIIKQKDEKLYKHLEKLQAEDCFFVYRMVLVLFRRELTFDQTLTLWEVMWADQAAIRAGIGRSGWSHIIWMRAPPTEDLLLYAIAACVLQRRKLIVGKYSSMDEIMRECNGLVGQLDVWKLLDDAHDLVVYLHDKI